MEWENKRAKKTFSITMRFIFLFLSVHFFTGVAGQNISGQLAGTWYVCKAIDPDEADTIYLEKTDSSVYQICTEKPCENTTFRFDSANNTVTINVYYFGCANDAVGVASLMQFRYFPDAETNELSFHKFSSAIMEWEFKYRFHVSKLTDRKLVLIRFTNPETGAFIIKK